MQLEIPTPEPVMVRRQEPLTMQLVDHLPNYCLLYIQKHANADDFNGITTNQSEGFDWLIKAAYSVTMNIFRKFLFSF